MFHLEQKMFGCQNKPHMRSQTNPGQITAGATKSVLPKARQTSQKRFGQLISSAFRLRVVLKDFSSAMWWRASCAGPREIAEKSSRDSRIAIADARYRIWVDTSAVGCNDFAGGPRIEGLLSN
jgi:hypothetical protein